MISNRFPKHHRLLKSRDYSRVQRHGKRIRTSYFVALYLPGKTKLPRFGLTVSRKAGKAHTRNRIKRHLRESIRHERQSVQRPWDVVFIATPKSQHASPQEVRSDVREVLEKIGRREGR